MIRKKFALILLALVFVVEAAALFWMRSDYRSVMLDGAEYQVPAVIDFRGISMAGITSPSTFP